MNALRIIQEEHHALAGVLQSSALLLRQGPGQDERRFFDALQAMLLYIEEYPEQRHHPKETDLLFPAVLRHAPALAPVIQRLDDDHGHGVASVRDLQHRLLKWRFMGPAHAPAFSDALTRYIASYLAHMEAEERQVLPVARELLSADEWHTLGQAFEGNQDPLAGHGPRDDVFATLFHRIVKDAPAPIGLGD